MVSNIGMHPLLSTSFAGWHWPLRLFVLSIVVLVGLFFVLGYKSYRTAADLREQICRLGLGKSSFEEVTELSHKYHGLILSHDNLPETCSPDGCTYRMYVENPLSRAVQIVPRSMFLAQVRVNGNLLKGRRLVVAHMWAHRERDVVVEQSSEADWEGDARIARYSKVETIEVRVPAHAPARFAQLAESLDLVCFINIFGCDEPSKVLPFLKQKEGSYR